MRWQDVDLEIGDGAGPTDAADHDGLRHPEVAPVDAFDETPGVPDRGSRSHKKQQNERRLCWGSHGTTSISSARRATDQPLRPDTVSKQFRTMAKAAGLDITFHGLRHTHASLMLESGADLKITSSRLGHSSISITADLYTHVASTAEKAATEAFDKHLAPHLQRPLIASLLCPGVESSSSLKWRGGSLNSPKKSGVECSSIWICSRRKVYFLTSHARVSFGSSSESFASTSAESAGGVTYFIATGRRIPMLTVFRKTQRREQREIDRAETAMETWLARETEDGAEGE